MTRFWTAANWKLNKTPQEATEFLNAFLPNVKNIKCQLALYPQNFSCATVAENAKGTDVLWGSQNCYWESSGAFTGENSPAHLKDMGAGTVLVGHSERRALFGESNEETAKKVKAAQDNGLIPLLCVGETLEERQSGKTEDVVLTQVREGLSQSDQDKDFAIAYEPVWAIGTGQVATPEMAQDVHAAIRNALSTLTSEARANEIPILYGGSVKPANAAELADQRDIDGFLVGGASLEPGSFLEIAQSLSAKKF